jgi:antirestriction protein
MDHENYGGALSGECNPTEAREAAELLASVSDSEREAWAAWLDNGMNSDVDEFRENYFGEFSNDEEMAENLADEMGLLGEMPESLRYYFDYAAYARDLLCGDIWTNSGHYFWNR